MAVDTFQNDVIILGQLSASTMRIPAGAVSDGNIALVIPGIQATKLQHQYEERYAQESATTAVSEARVIHVVRGATAAGLDFKAGCVVPNVGAATITVDLLRNGSSILTATITLNNTQVAYQLVTAAGFTVSAWVVGDVLEVKTTATAGGGTLGKGVFASLHMREDAS